MTWFHFYDQFLIGGDQDQGLDEDDKDYTSPLMELISSSS